MTIKLFTIYDTKAGVYQYPFQAPTKGAAIRAFSDIANDPTHPIGKHPEDYVLFETGSFDDKTAELNTIHKESCGTAIEYLTDDTRMNRMMDPPLTNHLPQIAKKGK